MAGFTADEAMLMQMLGADHPVVQQAQQHLTWEQMRQRSLARQGTPIQDSDPQIAAAVDKAVIEKQGLPWPGAQPSPTPFGSKAAWDWPEGAKGPWMDWQTTMTQYAGQPSSVAPLSTTPTHDRMRSSGQPIVPPKPGTLSAIGEEALQAAPTSMAQKKLPLTGPVPWPGALGSYAERSQVDLGSPASQARMKEEATAKTAPRDVESERSDPLGYDRDKLVRQKAIASGIRDFSEGFGRVKSAGHILLGQPSGTEAESARGMEERAALQLQPENDPTSEYSKSVQRTAEKLLNMEEGSLSGASAAALQGYLPFVQRMRVLRDDQYRKQMSSLASKIGSFRKEIVANPTLKQLKNSLLQIGQGRELLSRTDRDPKAVGAAIINIARAMGEKGPLSDYDIQRWEQFPGLEGIAQNVEKFMTSRYNETLVGSFLKVLDDVEQFAKTKMSSEVQNAARAMDLGSEFERQEFASKAQEAGKSPEIPGGTDFEAIAWEALGFAKEDVQSANAPTVRLYDAEGEAYDIPAEQADYMRDKYGLTEGQ